MESPEPCSVPWIYRRTRHPVFAWLGLRPIFAQHTSAEHETLKRWACGRRRLVEIGVAEGASALALREAMSSLSYRPLSFESHSMDQCNETCCSIRGVYMPERYCGVDQRVWLESSGRLDDAD